MMNEIAPFQVNNVSNRNIISPVRSVPSVEMNPNFSRSQYQRHQNANTNQNHRPYYNTQTFNPYFAVHVLIEAGEIEETESGRGFAAYNRKREMPKSVLAIA